MEKWSGDKSARVDVQIKNRYERDEMGKNGREREGGRERERADVTHI